MIDEISNQFAESKLSDYIKNRYGAQDCVSEVKANKIYSRLLFQKVYGLSKIEKEKTSVQFLKAGTNGQINRGNLMTYDPFKGRRKIQVDAFLKTTNSNDYFLGEAKGTKDFTGKCPGNSHSCAHLISYEMINLSSSAFKCYQGYTQSFLSQSLGYLDAVIENKCSEMASLKFIWLICDNDTQMKSYYQGLGNGIVENINLLFPNEKGAFFLDKYSLENPEETCYLSTFIVKMDKVQNICKEMCRRFIENYFV